MSNFWEAFWSWKVWQLHNWIECSTSNLYKIDPKTLVAILQGALNLFKKTHLQFYRWSTDCGFGYSFWKTAPSFFRAASKHSLKPQLIKIAHKRFNFFFKNAFHFRVFNHFRAFLDTIFGCGFRGAVFEAARRPKTVVLKTVPI